MRIHINNYDRISGSSTDFSVRIPIGIDQSVKYTVTIESITIVENSLTSSGLGAIQVCSSTMEDNLSRSTGLESIASLPQVHSFSGDTSINNVYCYQGNCSFDIAKFNQIQQFQLRTLQNERITDENEQYFVKIQLNLTEN